MNGKVQVLKPTQAWSPRYGTAKTAKSAHRSKTVATLRRSHGPARPTGTPRLGMADYARLMAHARNKERALEKARHRLTTEQISAEQIRISVMRGNAFQAKQQHEARVRETLRKAESSS